MSKGKSESITALLALASIVALVGLGIAVPAFAQQGRVPFTPLKVQVPPLP
jgi:hypothetical protein